MDFGHAITQHYAHIATFLLILKLLQVIVTHTVVHFFPFILFIFAAPELLLSLLCFRRWVRRLDDWENFLKQMQHMCGFSPVWVNKCFFRSDFCVAWFRNEGKMRLMIARPVKYYLLPGERICHMCHKHMVECCRES